jgi:hypothetical protein
MAVRMHALPSRTFAVHRTVRIPNVFFLPNVSISQLHSSHGSHKPEAQVPCLVLEEEKDLTRAILLIYQCGQTGTCFTSASDSLMISCRHTHKRVRLRKASLTPAPVQGEMVAAYGVVRSLIVQISVGVLVKIITPVGALRAQGTFGAD